MAEPSDSTRPSTALDRGVDIAGVIVTDAPPPAIPAATVILVRDGVDDIEVLMLQRTGGGAFGGFWVFPGGRVDPEDVDELTTAAREAKEESGLDLDQSSFVRFSHWTPPPAEMKRFATWFFVAAAPTAGQAVEVDQGEIVGHEWLSIREAIARRDRKEIELAPPTFVTLSVLANSPTAAEAIEAARTRPVDVYETKLRKREGRAYTVFSGDVAYDDADLLDTDGPRHRLELTAANWTYERTV